MESLDRLLLSSGLIDKSTVAQLRASHSDDEIRTLLRMALFLNSQIKLSPDLFKDVLALGLELDSTELRIKLLQVQEAAKAICENTRNIYVAAMPKSGSSFLAGGLSKALNVPTRALTTSYPEPTNVGLHGREQEIDEFSIVKASLDNTGFVAQHHTKSTPYMIKLLSSYNISPIVTYRNIFDAMVSYDAMFIEGSWSHPFMQWSSKIPANYTELGFDERIDLISRNYAIWCIDFYLSWKRVEEAGYKFLWVDYDRYLSKSSGDKSKLCELLISYLKPSKAHEEKIYDVIVGEKVTGEDSRLRSGTSGEGLNRIPEEVKRYVIDYAKKFNKELKERDLKIIFGGVY